MKNKMNIKILVAYHKPYPMLKNDIFVPIHVGRDIAFQKSKDGIISQKDFQWLQTRCIGDNTQDHISHLNRDFCECTAIYWAWKNFQQLGNPDYIGLMHYRTLFDFLPYAKQQHIPFTHHLCYNTDFFAQLFQTYDGVISQKLDTAYMWATDPQLQGFKPNEDFFHFSSQNHPELASIFQQDWDIKTFHYKNMFILKKEDFFTYCNTLFGILMRVREENEARHFYKERTLGYLAELLSSIIFTYLEHQKGRKFLQVPWLSVPPHIQKSLYNQTKELGYTLLSALFSNQKLQVKRHKYSLLNQLAQYIEE